MRNVASLLLYRVIFSGLIVINSITGVSQTLEFTPSVKFSDNFHQFPVGEIGDRVFLLAGNTRFQTGYFGTYASMGEIALEKNRLKLISFSGNRSTFDEKNLEFRQEMDELINAWVHRDNIYILYMAKSEKLKLVVLDKDMAVLRTNEATMKERKKKKSAMVADQTQSYKFSLDNDHNQFALCIYQTIEIFDTTLSSKGLLKLNNEAEVVSAYLNNEKFFFVNSEDSDSKSAKATLCLYDISKKSLATEILHANAAAKWKHTLHPDPANQRLYYVCFSASDEWLSKKGILSHYLANKMHVYSYNFSLGDKTASQVSLEHYTTGKKKKVGIYQPQIADLFIANGLNLIVSPRWSETTIAGNRHYVNISAPEVYMFKILDGKLAKENVINKWAGGDANWYYLYPTAIIHSHGKHVALFHVGNDAYDLKKVVFDDQLVILNTETINTYKASGYYLALDEFLKQNNGNFLFWGRYNKNTGCATLRFN